MAKIVQIQLIFNQEKQEKLLVVLKVGRITYQETKQKHPKQTNQPTTTKTQTNKKNHQKP